MIMPKVGIEGNKRDGYNFVLYWPDGKPRTKYLIGYPSDKGMFEAILRAVNTHEDMLAYLKELQTAALHRGIEDIRLDILVAMAEGDTE